MFRSPLSHFLLVGALLFGVQRAYSGFSEPIVVEVLQSEIDQRLEAFRRQSGRAPNAPEAASIENQLIENALWVEQARALGLHQTDLIVRQRLILNMRFLDDQTDAPDGELFDRAIALGMDQTDAVVQRRLVDRVQAMIRAGVRSKMPDDDVLRAHYESTARRWREPPLLDLTHVYFSRDKRTARGGTDAAALLPKLLREKIGADAAVALADPFLSGHRLRAATPNRIVARFGPAFAAAVEAQPVSAWVGPIESAFGAHLVWIHERIESRIPTFAEVREEVLEDWMTQETQRALRAQIERRRQIVEVRVIRDRQAPPDVNRRDEDA